MRREKLKVEPNIENETDDIEISTMRHAIECGMPIK